MGIATGEAELRGDDYFGTVLNRTARVMAAGHGGQVLLDGAVYESFARTGENMTNAGMATYAFDQIDRARSHLQHDSDSL